MAASSACDRRSRTRIIPVLLLACLAGGAWAQDALRGKRLYHDIGRMTGAGSSCIDCHGGVPGALHGIGKAAGQPQAILYALGAVQQMSVLRGRLDARDMADIAAYLEYPAVPSPAPRVSISVNTIPQSNPGRLDFVPGKQKAPPQTGTIRIDNAGTTALRLLSAPVLDGADAAWFAILASDCREGMTLDAGEGCSITVAFRPRGPGGRKVARIGLAHDWVNGGVYVALTGRNS
jgi:cytochrome c553